MEITLHCKEMDPVQSVTFKTVAVAEAAAKSLMSLIEDMVEQDDSGEGDKDG